MRRRDVFKPVGLAAGALTLGARAFADDDLSVTIKLGGKDLLFGASVGARTSDAQEIRDRHRPIPDQ